MKYIIFTLFCLLLTATTAITSTCTYQTGKASDHCFKLSLSKCDKTSPWTLHGLWPQWAQFCQGHVKVSCQNADALYSKYLSDMTDVIDEMKEEFPTCFYKCHTLELGNKWFWLHEWIKHGTCAGMDGPKQYFQKAMDLLEKYSDEHCPKNQTHCSICFNGDLSNILKCD